MPGYGYALVDAGAFVVMLGIGVTAGLLYWALDRIEHQPPRKEKPKNDQDQMETPHEA